MVFFPNVVFVPVALYKIRARNLRVREHLIIAVNVTQRIGQACVIKGDILYPELPVKKAKAAKVNISIPCRRDVLVLIR